jgi:hypothetical protein
LYTSVVPQLTLVTSRLCLACRHTPAIKVSKNFLLIRHDTTRNTTHNVDYAP